MSVDGGARAASTGTTAWRNAVMGVFALGGVAISTWGPRLPSIRESLGVGDAALGVALAGVTVGSITGLAVSAALLARFGPRRAILGSMLLIAAGVAVIALGAGPAASLALAGVGFVAVGLGLGSMDVMINVQGAALEAAAGRTLMPLLHAAWSAGAILGSAIGAAAAALHVAFVVQFLAEAVLIALVGAVCTRYLRDVADPASADAAPSRAARLRSWLRGWTDLRLLAIGLVMLGVELGEGTSNSWLTLAVRDGHDQTDAVAALFFVAFNVGETAARVFGGPLVDRLGRVRTVRITTALGVIGVLLFILGTPAWVILIGTVLWSVGVSMGFPLGMSAAADSGPNPAARVSVVASIGYLANLGGPPVIGALSQGFGLLNAFWLVLALLAVGFLAAGALRSRVRA